MKNSYINKWLRPVQMRIKGLTWKEEQIYCSEGVILIRRTSTGHS